MNREDQLKNLDQFISLVDQWFDFRHRGQYDKRDKATQELESIWGITEEILKQTGISYNGELHDHRIKGMKNPVGDYFIDGFIAGNDDSYKISSILKLKALANSARAKIKLNTPLIANTLPSVNQVINILGRLPDVISRLKHRRKGKEPFLISDEYDMQDILYVMLKGPFPTLQYEDPNKKVGTTSSTIDFTISELGLYIEAKFIDSKGKEKEVQKQCREDIISYGGQQDCNKVIFVVLDIANSIDNEYAFKQGLEGKFTIKDREVEVLTLVIR